MQGAAETRRKGVGGRVPDVTHHGDFAEPQPVGGENRSTAGPQ